MAFCMVGEFVTTCLMCWQETIKIAHFYKEERVVCQLTEDKSIDHGLVKNQHKNQLYFLWKSQRHWLYTVHAELQGTFLKATIEPI